MSAIPGKIHISHQTPADPTRQHPLTRPLAATAASLAALIWLAACATDKLDTSPPKGVNLTGEWQLNPNLSDDPQKPPPDDSTTPGNMRHRSGRGRGGSGGSPPYGLPGSAGGRTGGTEPDSTQDLTNNTNTGASTYVRTLWQYPGGYGPPSGGGPRGGNTGRSRGNRFGHWLDAPDHMTIEQSGSKLTIRSKSSGGELKTDEFVIGHSGDIPIGQSTAERDVGWRGNIFVIDTKVKDGPTKEDDYALDDDGRLIVSTLMTGGHMPKIDIKRVYDRTSGAQGVRQ
jgi:hypothetical protein